ncbi:MAG TPA: hydrogenase maturation protease [Acidimicrobiia bacterium]
MVIGVGNPFRGDDGAGLRAIALARPDLPAGVRVVESDGEPARVLDAWEGADLAVVVDAMRSGAEPGTVVRAEAGRDALPEPVGGGSTHALGIGEAVALGRALDRLPARVVVFGIEGERFDAGVGLTPAVARGAAQAAHLVCAEVPTGRPVRARTTGGAPCA